MIPFSVIDLSPIVRGHTATDAFRNTLALAQQAEQLGYFEPVTPSQRIRAVPGAGLRRFLTDTQADELMITTPIDDPAIARRSLEINAQVRQRLATVLTSLFWWVNHKPGHYTVTGSVVKTLLNK